MLAAATGNVRSRTVGESEFHGKRRAAFAEGAPLRRRDYLDAMAWNRAHPEAERLVRLAQAMRAAQAAGLDVQQRLAELERVA